MNAPDLAKEAATYLHADPASFRFLRYSQNFVFSYTDRDGREGILRATSDGHRSRAEIAAELEWITFLHQSGASVCAPLFENHRRLFTIQRNAESFHCVPFEKAAGRPIGKADLSPALYRTHGSTIGTLHRLAIDYPAGRMAPRKQWDEERYFTADIAQYLPAELQEPLRNAFARLRARVNTPRPSARTFGAVHFDPGYSNAFIEEERLRFFDFDNCTLAPFIGDIAAALYSTIFTSLRCEFPGDRSPFEPPESNRILAEVLPSFREGYESVFDWPENWHQQLQPWLEVMYFRAVIHAWRLQSPTTNPVVRAALKSDVENLLRGTTPVSL